MCRSTIGSRGWSGGYAARRNYDHVATTGHSIPQQARANSGAVHRVVPRRSHNAPVGGARPDLQVRSRIPRPRPAMQSH